MAAESQAAILAYKKAALATIDEGVIVGRGVQAHTFNCFGLALKRAGEFDMAERAYRFALSERNSGMSSIVRDNMGALAEARMMQPRDRKLVDEQSLADQNKIVAENAKEMPTQKKKKGKRNKPKLAISDDAPQRKHKQCACCLDVKAQSELSVCAACKQVPHSQFRAAGAATFTSSFTGAIFLGCVLQQGVPKKALETPQT